MKVTSVPDTLDYLMAGYGEDEALVALARSENFPVGDAAQCRQHLAIEPMTLGNNGDSCAVALSKFDEERAILAYVWSPDEKDSSSRYQYVLIPYDLLRPKRAGLERILESLPNEVTPDEESGSRISMRPTVRTMRLKRALVALARSSATCWIAISTWR